MCKKEREHGTSFAAIYQLELVWWLLGPLMLSNLTNILLSAQWPDGLTSLAHPPQPEACQLPYADLVFGSGRRASGVVYRDDTF